MRPAIIRAVRTRAFDVLIEEMPHRWCAHQRVVRRGRQFAVMIIGAAKIDYHVSLRLVVADALNETTSVDIAALECFKINRAAIFYVNGFGAHFGGEQENDECRRYSGHHLGLLLNILKGVSCCLQ